RAMKSPPTNIGLAPRPPTARSRVTNGADLLPGIDGRSALARRLYDVTCAIAADQGGTDRLSEARVQLIRRFAAASVLAEAIVARISCRAIRLANDVRRDCRVPAMHRPHRAPSCWFGPGVLDRVWPACGQVICAGAHRGVPGVLLQLATLLGAGRARHRLDNC